ncbi:MULTISPECIES: phosphoketolase family protein [Rhodopirellula]|uniref:phosphoketolase family protein n=1 Tax=Rhodopirellula TaxID=265488 RepID=UPI00257EB399|nr:phosphoketolase family protein [Rhodopirellula sp. UBA1907]
MRGNTHVIQRPSLADLNSYWLATNYLSAAQIYLRENPLLQEPLRPDHIKPRLLGHWGTCPGINLIATHLNRLIVNHDQPTLLITGPGHGAPAVLSNLFLEGSLGERYREYEVDGEGAKNLVRDFSWPGGFPSHLTPATPGTIHEGGELGYALATAFGAAMDNPDLLVACIVGDGEAETGPTATAWHLTKYLNPERDGAVLPIVHLNQYKIASRTIFGAMSDGELRDLFHGYGYEPILIEAHDSENSADEKVPVANHREVANAFDQAIDRIQNLQRCWRNGEGEPRPRWPVILLRSSKGWTVTKELDGERIEGTHRSHQVPVEDPRNDPQHLEALDSWLRSYQPEVLFEEDGSPKPSITHWLPKGARRLGMIPEANGGSIRKPMTIPDWKQYELDIDRNHRGRETASDMKTTGEFLRDVIDRNRGRFRLFCPDELNSNRLGATLDASQRQFVWPTPADDPNIGMQGSVFEMLSEHTCQACMQGYLLTGRHAIFPCYEAFVSIVDSMMGQYAKFLKRSDEIEWRDQVSSFNYLLSSEGWRQDHNGYSHQMPGFLNMLLNKKAQNVRVYLPPDANCLLSTIDHCMRSTGKINLVIASKQPMPQWLSAEEAEEHCRNGLSIWDWASSPADEKIDVVLACAGVYPTAEAVVASRLLRQTIPDLRIRLVNITDLLILEQQSFHPHGLNNEQFDHFFPPGTPVIFNFHGYPSAIKQLLWNRPGHERFRINGYIEEGTTTTPFSLLAANGIDRYTLVDQVLCAGAIERPELRERCVQTRAHFQDVRAEMIRHAQHNGEDMASFTQWEIEPLANAVQGDPT